MDGASEPLSATLQTCGRQHNRACSGLTGAPNLFRQSIAGTVQHRSYAMQDAFHFDARLKRASTAAVIGLTVLCVRSFRDD